MNKEELIKELKKLTKYGDGDYEGGHGDADDLLVKYIDDAEITKAYDNVGKWYA